MAGINSDHTEAATITPAANPRKILCTDALTSLRKKKTTDAPSVVIKNVNPVPPAAHNKDVLIIKPPFGF